MTNGKREQQKKNEKKKSTGIPDWAFGVAVTNPSQRNGSPKKADCSPSLANGEGEPLRKKRESKIHTKSSRCSPRIENGTKMKTEEAHSKAS